MTAIHTRPRMVIYLDDDVKDWWERSAAMLGVKPSTYVSMLLAGIANTNSSPLQLLDAVQQCLVRHNGVMPSTSVTHRVVSEPPQNSVDVNQLSHPEHIHSSTLPLKKREKKKTSSDEPEGFPAFWEAVPRKVGKGQARKAYATALNKVTAERLEREAMKWATAVNGTDPKFVPHPATWLNGERWEDEPDAVASPFGGGGYDAAAQDRRLERTRLENEARRRGEEIWP
jgi:hypothetical protein